MNIKDVENMIERAMHYSGERDIRKWCLKTSELGGVVKKVITTKFGNIEVINVEDIPPETVYLINKEEKND